MLRVMPETIGIGDPAEQTMDRKRLARQALAQIGVEFGGARAQRRHHARRRLAGRRCDSDAQARLQRQQTGEDRDHGGRLAGARAAADDRQPVRQRDRGGDPLPIDSPGGGSLAVALEMLCQQRAHFGCRQRNFGSAGKPVQRVREPPLVVVVAEQVQPVRGVEQQRQRRDAIFTRDHLRPEQPGAPAFGIAAQHRQRNASMAVRERRNQCSDRVTQRVDRVIRHRGVAAQARQAFAQSGREMAGRAVGGRVDHFAAPANIRSSAASSDSSGRSNSIPAGRPSGCCQPGCTPRTKTYSTPPKSRA